MLDSLITSKTRIKLLLKFFLNSSRVDYLRGLESDLGDNTNAIRVELNNLEKAGLLSSFNKGNKKFFKSNHEHPLFPDIQSILMKITGVDEVLKGIIANAGDLHEVYLTGELAKGNYSEVIDLILVGELNKEYIFGLFIKVEKFVEKKVRFIVFTPEEFFSIRSTILKEEDLLIWKK